MFNLSKEIFIPNFAKEESSRLLGFTFVSSGLEYYLLACINYGID